MNMKRLIKAIVFVILVGVVFSLLPLASLYIKSDPEPYTNDETIAKLKGNEGDYFGFIVFGDNHSGLFFNDSTTLKLIRHINREDRFKKFPIDFVAVTGDVTFRGSRWDYRVYNRIRSLIKWPVISGVGNHDDDKGTLADFIKYIGRPEFSFADRDSYFIFIDDNIGDMTAEQFVRLEDDLKRSLAYKHRFIMTHKAPLSLYQQSWFRPELSPWAYRFMKLCEQYAVDIVFTGHEHLFKKATFGGVRYIMSGGGGMLTQLATREGAYPHYLVVRVYGDYVDYEVRRVFPPLWEYLAYYMWRDLFYFLRDVVF